MLFRESSVSYLRGSWVVATLVPKPPGGSIEILAMATADFGGRNERCAPQVLSWSLARGKVEKTVTLPALPRCALQVAGGRVSSGKFERILVLASGHTYDAQSPLYLGVSDTSGKLLREYKQIAAFAGSATVDSDGVTTVGAWIEASAAEPGKASRAAIHVATIDADGEFTGRRSFKLPPDIVAFDLRATGVLVRGPTVYFVEPVSGGAIVHAYDVGLKYEVASFEYRPTNLDSPEIAASWSYTPIGSLSMIGREIVFSVPEKIFFLSTKLALTRSISIDLQDPRGAAAAVASHGAMINANGYCSKAEGPLRKCFDADPSGPEFKGCSNTGQVRSILAVEGKLVHLLSCEDVTRLAILEPYSGLQ